MNEKYLEGSEELVAQLTEWRIQKAQAELRVPRPEDWDGECPDCGIAVPEQRVALGFYNCVDCQTELEKLKRRTT